MLVVDFNNSVRYTLQDTNKSRWLDAELLDYTNEGIRDIALRTFYNRVVETISVQSGITTYTLLKPVISIDNVDTIQQHTIGNNHEIIFVDPKAQDIEVIYYAYPDTITDTITADVNIIDALKYYVLHKCYEKEDSPENFNKASYFMQKYLSVASENMSQRHGDISVTVAKNDYFN